MSTEIRIAPDQTVSACWNGPKGRGSLFQCMAGGAYANALEFEELADYARLIQDNRNSSTGGAHT